MKSIVYKLGLLTSTLLLLGAFGIGAARADGGARGEEYVQIIQGYQVALTFAAPAQVGENAFHLRLNDGQAQPVTHAEINVSVVAGETGHAEAGQDDGGHDEAEASQDTHNAAVASSTHSDTNIHAQAEPQSNMDMPSEANTHSGTELHSDTSVRLIEETHGAYAGTVVLPEVALGSCKYM